MLMTVVFWQNVAEGIGKKVIYGDTDSTFAKGIVNPEIGLQLQEELDNFLLQCAWFAL